MGIRRTGTGGGGVGGWMEYNSGRETKCGFSSSRITSVAVSYERKGDATDDEMMPPLYLT